MELTDALLPIEVLYGSLIGIQFIYDTVDIQIGKPRVEFVGCIDSERIGNALAPIEPLLTLVNIVRIPNLRVYREGRVGQYDTDHLLDLLSAPRNFYIAPISICIVQIVILGFNASVFYVITYALQKCFALYKETV